jgi:flagellar hook-associated protein 1 FlgK
MSLSTAFAIASQSLGTLSNQINIASENVSGANTTGYSTKSANVVTGLDGSAQISGVTRATNAAMLKAALATTSQQGSTSALSAGLDQIDQFLNISSSSASSTSSSRTPADMIANLAASLQAFASTPTSASAAQTVLSNAQSLAQSLNAATTQTQSVRQQADSSIASAVTNINQLLSQFQSVNNAIVSGTQSGADITTALDQRDQLVTQLSQYMGISTVPGPNNDMSLYTDSGVTLFQTTPRSVTFQPTASLSAGTSGNPVYIDGMQVTGSPSPTMALQSGSLVGLTQLRDVVAPQFQDQLDETARGIINAFAESDQNDPTQPKLAGLFTTSAGIAAGNPLPGSSLVPGLAAQIVVNPDVDPSQGGNLSLLQYGGISGNSAYAFPSQGASGASAYIQQLLNGLSAIQSFEPSAGNGTSASVTSYATSSVGWFEAQRQTADNAATYQNALLSQAQTALSSATGVNLDAQMSQMLSLENSYQASAKLLAAVNDLYTTLFTALQPQAQP